MRQFVSKKPVIVLLLASLFLLAPNPVLAQEDVPLDSKIKLSPEQPQAAPLPQPTSAVMTPSTSTEQRPIQNNAQPSRNGNYTEPAANGNYAEPMPEQGAPPTVRGEMPNYSPSQPSAAEQPGCQPFQYPRFHNYRNRRQQGYGEPYTRPGYYPSGSPDDQPAPPFVPYGTQPAALSDQYNVGLSYIPQGMILPIDLRTAISTQVAKEGDFIEATVNTNVPLNGTAYLPAGSVVSGEITEAKAGRRLSRSGSLSIQFNNLRLPSGVSFPISAHLLGSIGRYKDVNGVERGEGWKAKLGQFALRGVGGAGLGAALGTGLGAVVDGGSGAGTGAWAGAAFGGGLGAMDMLLRKGRDVIIPSGTEMKLQMDQPLRYPTGASPY